MRLCDLFGTSSLADCARDLLWRVFVKLCGEDRPLKGSPPAAGPRSP